MQDTIQNLNKKLSQPFVLFIIFAVIICISFLLLVPKFSSTLFPQKRAAMLQDFLQTTEVSHHLDPRKYWEFREFYSPGYFTFDRTGVPQEMIHEVLGSTHITVTDAAALGFLRFHSPYLNSLDYLTTKQSIADALTTTNVAKILYSDKTTQIFQDDTNQTIIIFLLTADEMKKANGFFDYGEKDKNLVSGKHWLNITAIKKN